VSKLHTDYIYKKLTQNYFTIAYKKNLKYKY